MAKPGIVLLWLLGLSLSLLSILLSILMIKVESHFNLVQNISAELMATSHSDPLSSSNSSSISQTPVDFSYPSFTCSAEQVQRQVDNFCKTYGGRHNLKFIFSFLRFHLPDARLLVDAGANKGLISARWLELWRPELGIYPREYARNFIAPYFALHNATKKIAGDACGVTPMCDLPDAKEAAMLARNSPRTPETPLVVHSLEPSPPLYNMHLSYQMNNTTKKRELSEVWRWHERAVSDYVGEVYFDWKWHEGGKINARAKYEPNTKVISLDHLAYHDNLFGDEILDIVKIDCETVDANVIAGAARLIKEERIRVIMWETPNSENFPLTSTIWGEESIPDFGGLIDQLDKEGMTCYFPGTGRHVKLTGCWNEAIAHAPRCISPNCPYGEGCNIQHGNALCVHRKLAPSLYQSMEAQAWIHYADLIAPK